MINVSRKEIARYLGYRGITPDAAVSDEIERAVGELNSAVSPAHIFREFPLELYSAASESAETGSAAPGNAAAESAGTISFAGLSVQSKSLSRNLAGCHKIVILAATLGVGADRLIARAQVRSMTQASVLQAAGAAMIEAYVEEVNRKIRDEHTAEGLYLRPRFSPGYGDLPLTLQKDIIRILNTPKTIGVSLTDACLMVPSKSVTALIGVSGNDSRCVMAGCEECSSRDTCVYRR